METNTFNKFSLRELSDCIIKNKPNILEKCVMLSLMRRYEEYNLSSASAYVLVRRISSFDNVFLAHIAAQMLAGKPSKDLDKLDRLVKEQCFVKEDIRPEYINRLKN